MNPVFVVIGSTGEYSDRTEWVVCAYKDEELAKQHVVLAKQRAQEIRVTRNDLVFPYHRESKAPYVYFGGKPEEPASRYDLFIRVDYTGTDYWYTTTEIRESLP